MKKNTASTFSSRDDALGRRDAAALHHLAPAELHRSARSTSQGGATNDPYNLLVDTFDTWWMTLIYLVAMLALGMHLHHGIWSAAQTLGLTNNARARRNAKALGCDRRAWSSPAASRSSRSSSSPASSPVAKGHRT